MSPDPETKIADRRLVIAAVMLLIAKSTRMPNSERHPNNAPGDFYVERDCCLACEAPCNEAPDLMGRPYSTPEDPGCFFAKQPRTEDEVERACNAVAFSCVEGVRYSGSDPAILRFLYDNLSYGSCDVMQTPLEARVSEDIKRIYKSAARHGVQWTYIRDRSDTQTIVACCYGRDGRTLGVFSVDHASQQVELVVDDHNYRPSVDIFKRPTKSIWCWLRFW